MMALVVVARGIGALGPGEEDAVAWFGRIEGRVVDDHRERESFGSEERKIAEQPGDIRGRAGGSARRLRSASTGTAIVVRPLLSTAIEEVSGSANPSGSATVTERICTSPSTRSSSGSSQAQPDGSGTRRFQSLGTKASVYGRQMSRSARPARATVLPVLSVSS